MNNKLTLMRSVGNISIIIGYLILLNFNLLWGIIIKLIAASLVIPWATKYKFWDVVALNAFMGAIELHQLFLILFF